MGLFQRPQRALLKNFVIAAKLLLQVPSTKFKIMASRNNHQILPEVILLWFLEVLGAVTAILFGIFGVMSWKAADEANEKSDVANSRSDTANLVALVALCAQLGTGDDVSPTTPGDNAYSVRRATCRRGCTENGKPDKKSLVQLCSGIQTAAKPKISSIASSFFDMIETTTIPTTTIPTTTILLASSSATSEQPSLTFSLASGLPAWSTPLGGSANPTLAPNTDLALGLGLSLGCVVSFISAMTIWAAVKRRRTPPEGPPKDQ